MLIPFSLDKDINGWIYFNLLIKQLESNIWEIKKLLYDILVNQNLLSNIWLLMLKQNLLSLLNI